MENEYVVQIHNVCKEYAHKGSGMLAVLNDINLQVKAGAFVSFIGPSGCGKSTLLRLILGAELPTSGYILIGGKKAGGPNRDRGIVFQRYSLFPHLTVLENVMFGLELEQINLVKKWLWYHGYRKKRAEFADEAMEYLRRVRLHEHANKYPHELSGGMQQRVAIAQALIMKPIVLLMDEPFGALDPGTREEMQMLLLQLWEKERMTIFFVTHDLEEALFLGERILVLSPYYRTDEGSAEGSRIVIDKKPPGEHPKTIHDKYTPEFNVLLEQIRREGFTESHLQHIQEFDLSHPDSFSR